MAHSKMTRPATQNDLETALLEIGKFVTARLAPLKQRLDALEARPELKYFGVWAEGTYKESALVTHGGSMWICKRDTKAKPQTNDDWQLIVRRGRDGKPR